jgi:preprotein translocase subunit Sec61beta
MAARDDPGRPAEPTRNAGFLATLRAVLWSFFGVRRRSEYEKDAVHLNPVYVIVAGIAAAAVFVLVLLMVVRMVVSQ